MPKSTDTLIADGERRMNIAENIFNSNTKRAESAIYQELQKLFDSIDITAGKIKNSRKTMEFLHSLELRIYDALNNSGYNGAVKNYLKNFDRIRDNNIDIQAKLNKKVLSPGSFDDITRMETQAAIERLTGSGISKDFIIPIKESLYRNIYLGADIATARKTIEDYVLTKEGQESKLLRYTRQVARDTINQYDGAIQKVIANELDLPDYLYAGSLIQDSRGQCKYWVEKTKLLGEELKAEIEQAIAGRTLGGYKCSGMIPQTSVDTFSIYRGGYNCRHRAIATKF